MARYVGKCSRCGQIHYSDHREPIVCDCWKKCPLCGLEMEPYTPDLALNTYGLGDRRDLQIHLVCNNTVEHPSSSPFYSKQKPVEVELA